MMMLRRLLLSTTSRSVARRRRRRRTSDESRDDIIICLENLVERKRRSYSSVRDAARDVYHTSLDCDQFDVSRDQSKTRARLLATCSALASMYIGYHAAPLLAEGSINSAMYMVEHEKNFMRKRGVWRFEWLLESIGGGHTMMMMVDKCVEKGAMEALLKVCEIKETETDEDTREGARKVLTTLVKTESGRKRVDGDVRLRKRVRRALGKEYE